MRSTVRLAQSLAGFDADALERLVLARALDGEIEHVTELAIRLLDASNIARALRERSLRELQVLAGKAEDGAAHEQLLGLGLLTAEGPLPEVAEVLEQLLEAHGPLPESGEAPNTQPNGNPNTAWAQRAFLESQRAVLIVQSATHTPIKLTRTGHVTKVAVKQLSEATFGPAETMPLTVSGLTLLGALTLREQHLVVTQRACDWVVQDHAARWVGLASAVLGSAPPVLREGLRTPGRDVNALVKYTSTVAYPLMSEGMRSELEQFAVRCEHFGVTEQGVLTEVAHCLTVQPAETGRALDLAQQAFPATVSAVYLQPDLSVIAPGPLDPPIGLTLLRLADLTAPGLATTLTLSEQSLNAALDRGWTAPEIREFLQRVSLTPLPQPLEYLLSDLAERHGTIEVRPLNTPDGATVIGVRDERIARELLADPRLQVLGLAPTERSTELMTRFGLPHVFSMLLDARYPATKSASATNEADLFSPFTGDDSDLVRFIEGPNNTSCDEAANTRVEWARATAARLAAASNGQGGLDIVPVLELAARTGDTLSVTISDGTRDHVLNLQPVSIAGGRLRAVDPGAQLERTVSLRAITRVEPIHNPGG